MSPSEYITKYESALIAEYFQEFSVFYGLSVSSLELALSEIMSDLSHYEQGTPEPNRHFKHVAKFGEVVAIREGVAGFVKAGQLYYARCGLERTASILATLAWEQCCQ
jgi:hypothetical protein